MLYVMSVIYPACVLFSIQLTQKAETRVDDHPMSSLPVTSCDKEISLFRDIYRVDISASYPGCPLNFISVPPGCCMDEILGGSLRSSALLLPCQVPEGHREETCKLHTHTSTQTEHIRAMHFGSRWQNLLFYMFVCVGRWELWISHFYRQMARKSLFPLREFSPRIELFLMDFCSLLYCLQMWRFPIINFFVIMLRFVCQMQLTTWTSS